MIDPDIYLSKEEQERVRTLLKQTGTVTDGASKVAEYLKEGKSWAEAINTAVPWLKDVADAAGEAFSTVRFLVKLGEKWLPGKTHPYALGAVACTMVYQKLAGQAIKKVWTSALGYQQALKVDDAAASQIRDLPPAEAADLSTFSYDLALQHGFILNADKILDALMMAGGFTEEQGRDVFKIIHDQFVTELKSVLADKQTADKFEPFAKLLEMGTEGRQVQVALNIHAKYQVALYESEPLFKSEPYALKHIYVETECGVLKWGEIRKRESKERTRNAPELDEDQAGSGCDPFSENHGGRHNLLKTVMTLITDRRFNEPIVVQGIAGAGKSSFTLRLCTELWEQGFHPIRIRFKRLRLGASLMEALNEAIELADEDRVPDLPFARPEDLLGDGQVFTDPWGNEHWLARHVLILDGWDELDLSDNKSFREKVGEVLRLVRDKFLNAQRSPRVRVIVTGRPTPDVTSSRFLNDETPILTLRPISPAQVQSFISQLKQALEERPVPIEQPEEEQWKVHNPTNFKVLVDPYEAAFKRSLPEYDAQGKIIRLGEPPASDSFEVLGLPLLLYLTVRVVSESLGKEPGTSQDQMLLPLVKDPTTLYRWLMDQTCEKAGKAAIDRHDSSSDIARQAREHGLELRRKLQFTAAAMSISGKEFISYDEWSRRMRALTDEEATHDEDKTTDHPLARLTVSYYFKGGHTEQSCEFAHKSFREYLFAEALVEALKKYGQRVSKPWPTVRKRSWRDFSETEDSERFKLSRSLSELLAPQWLTPEVWRHLRSLLAWEISREKQPPRAPQTGMETEMVTLEKWALIRDGLADLWEWWCDQTHLRPQIIRSRLETKQEPPYAQELVFWSAPEKRDAETALESLATMDAHLGEALCQLCAEVHFQVAIQQGWKWREAQSLSETRAEHWYQYQLATSDGQMMYTLFAPAGRPDQFLLNPAFLSILARINSADGRPQGQFPSHASLDGASLDGAILTGASLDGASLAGASLDGASLDGASLAGASLAGAILTGASLNRASLNRASLDGARLAGASLNRAILAGASLDGASLDGASLDGAILNGAILNRAILAGADLSRVIGLRWEQIDAALIDEETKLPPEFERQRLQKLARQEELRAAQDIRRLPPGDEADFDDLTDTDEEGDEMA